MGDLTHQDASQTVHGRTGAKRPSQEDVMRNQDIFKEDAFAGFLASLQKDQLGELAVDLIDPDHSIEYPITGSEHAVINDESAMTSNNSAMTNNADGMTVDTSNEDAMTRTVYSTQNTKLKLSDSEEQVK